MTAIPRLAWSAAELAAALGVSRDVIYRDIHAGRIANSRVGGEHRIPITEVARLTGIDPAELDALLTRIAERRSA